MNKMLNTIKTIILSLLILSCTSLNAFASEVFYNSQDFKNGLYNHLKNRETNFTLYYKDNDIGGTLEDACEMDDYLERSVSAYNIKIAGSKDMFNITYRTTKEQEQYIDKELRRIVDNLIDPNMSDIDKVVAINNYLVKIYKYDDTIKSDNVYSALTTGKTICQGYSMTAYKMFKLSGLECRIVIGTINGSGHAWNLVKVKDNWYHIDITNNDNIVRDKYLLVSDDYLINNGFSWDRSKYQSSPYNYYNNSKMYVDYNNDKESDILEYYNGGNWYKENGFWYYWRVSGVNAIGWLNNNGNWYYLDENGKMQTGWIYDHGNWYYCWYDGKMATSTIINGYRVNENGAWIR